MNFPIAAFGMTDVGRKREANEDAFLVDEDLGLFLVADGVGGHEHGEVASSLATGLIRESLLGQRETLRSLRAVHRSSARDSMQQLLHDAITRACARIWDLAVHNRDRRGMGCTLDALLDTGEGFVLAHVGDVRTYLVRDGALHRLTEDHTLIEQQLKAGLISKEEAATSSWKGIVTRVLGIHQSVPVDLLHLDVQPGDRLLMCSDGVYNHLDDRALLELAGNSDAESVAVRLIHSANAAGGSDNLTAVVVDIPARVPDSSRIAASTQLRLLAQMSLFSALTFKEQASVLAIGNVREHAKGDVIVREGAPGEEMYLVLDGRIAIEKAGERLRELDAGAHFGEMSLVQRAPRSASAIALQPSRTLCITHASMMALMRREPTLAVKLLWTFVQTLSGHLRNASDELVEATIELVQRRVDEPYRAHKD